MKQSDLYLPPSEKPWKILPWKEGAVIFANEDYEPRILIDGVLKVITLEDHEPRNSAGQVRRRPEE